jgi:peptidoglycan/LPS O-acetylase OafA/YrhL
MMTADRPAVPRATSPRATSPCATGADGAGAPAGAAAARDRYVDLLRALAILRVYLLHTLWLSWLPGVFPAMWVMFALGGYLTAIALDRGGPWRVIRSRLRRLLPPLWVLAAVAVPLMLLHGWADDPAGPPGALTLANWLLPLANPPASEWGGPFAQALWYLRAYLWLVLASPALWWAFRRWPAATLAALPGAAVLFSSPLVELPANPLGDGLWATASYGTCWLLGFARHTGHLDRVPPRALGAFAAGIAATGALWGATHPRPDRLADMLWGVAFVVILMRLRPRLNWLDRARWLSAAISAVNARAVSIYVWHLPAAFAATTLLAAGPASNRLTALAVTTAILAGIVLAVGWVEDVAALRRPRLLPRPGKPPAERPQARSDLTRPQAQSHPARPHMTTERHSLVTHVASRVPPWRVLGR